MRLGSERNEDRLRRLAEIIDPALAHLSTTELLREVLARVRDLLAVDTVTVLQVDDTGTRLVATHALGLEEEVYQGVQVPIGRGFAGQIAATQEPLVLEEVGPEHVVNPLLWRKGLHSLVGVPLISEGRVVGVLHVGSLHPRHFAAEEISVLQAAADRVASALSAHQTAEERSAARTLQHGLQPTKVADFAGLELGSRFAAAEDFGVGGDWFDVFELPGGAVGIVMGDVAGSGLRAAIVMARARSALRAYALEHPSPGDVLDRLDRKFAHFERYEMATVLYLVVAPDRRSFTVATAGHPPPVMALPDGPAELLEWHAGPPIGAHVYGRRTDLEVELPLGAAVGCYTDGLIERRGESIDAGFERLCRAFRCGEPEAVCGEIMAELIGDATPADDTALLVFRRIA